jgi:hypothetical protein
MKYAYLSCLGVKPWEERIALENILSFICLLEKIILPTILIFI